MSRQIIFSNKRKFLVLLPDFLLAPANQWAIAVVGHSNCFDESPRKPLLNVLQLHFVIVQCVKDFGYIYLCLLRDHILKSITKYKISSTNRNNMPVLLKRNSLTGEKQYFIYPLTIGGDPVSLAVILWWQRVFTGYDMLYCSTSWPNSV